MTNSVTSNAPAGQSSASIFVPPGSTDAQIAAAIGSLSALGGGTVYLGAGTYTLNNPVTMANNVSIVGVPCAFPPVTGLLNNTWTLAGGTILAAGASTQGFIWNPTNSGVAPGSPPNDGWGNNQLSGVILQNLAFSGFSDSAIRFGAQNKEGLVMGRIQHVAAFNCGSYGTTYDNGTFAFEFRNCGGNNFSEIYLCKCPNGLRYMSSVAQVTQQLGNSVFSDIQIDGTNIPTVNANFSRPCFIGADPNIATSFSNEIRMSALAIYYFNSGAGRTTTTDTATFTGGTTFTVATGTNFPVGMPVKFSASNGNIQGGFTYFILSQSGNTLSIGNQRGDTTAITLPGSGTLTISQYGYPLLDVGGLANSTSGMPSSFFTGLDLEGGCIGNVYAENCNGLFLQINQATNAFSQAGLVARSSTLEVHNQGSGFAPDLDSGTRNGSYWFGNIKAGIQFSSYPQGLYNDNTNNVQSLTVVANGAPRLSAPGLFVKGNNGFLYPNMPQGETINIELTATGSIQNYRGGLYTVNSAGATTQTLPALVNDASLVSGSGGLRYKFVNIGAGACVIAGNSNTAGQRINNQTLTNNQVSLAQNQYAEFICTLASNGTTTYWAVLTNGTIS